MLQHTTARSAGPLALLLGLVALLGLVRPQAAIAGEQVDLELVLAVDASGSVSQDRFELQKQGYVAAFRDPRVLKAILSGATRTIGVTMTQWTGPVLQVQVVPWMRVGDADQAAALAQAIANAPRHLFSGGTSISGAIDNAMTLFGRGPFEGMRRVIDVSGDGSNNRGRPAAEARDAAVAAGAGINGLAILVLEPRLDKYYRNNVIGGPNAFVLAVENYEAFAEAIIKKLILEIAELAPTMRRAHAEVAPPMPR